MDTSPFFREYTIKAGKKERKVLGEEGQFVIGERYNINNEYWTVTNMSNHSMTKEELPAEMQAQVA